MIQLAYNSIRFRTGHAFRGWMTDRYRRRVEALGLPRAPLAAKPVAPFALLQMVGAAQVSMMQQCLLSIHRSWPMLPPLQIVSDGSVQLDELLSATAWWPASRMAVQWQEQVASFPSLPPLASLAANNTLGRKLASVLAAAAAGPTLFCDSDVLWFDGPPRIPAHATGEPMLKTASDLSPMYDRHLLSEVSLGILNDPPWVNTGVCYAVGDLICRCNLAPVLEAAAANPGYFSEQTTLAIAARRLGQAPWPLDQVVLKVNDSIRWPHASFKGQKWLARHYPGTVRHWFWRDAWELARYGLSNQGGAT